MKYWYLIPLAIVAFILLLVGFSTDWDVAIMGLAFGGIVVAGGFYYLLGSSRYGKSKPSEVSS